MKLTEFITDVGRPVAYYPGLKKITGSTTATILLCQFIYWRGKESDPDGWLYKTSDDIEKETGLTYDEQRTARKKLIDNDLIEEHYARLDHQLRFRVKLDVINDKWGNQYPPDGEMGIAQMGKAESPNSLNESENTSENTTMGEIIESANKTVDAILDNERKAQAMKGKNYPLRDKIPEPYLEYADWYVEATGQKPRKNALTDWLLTFDDWTSAGVTVENLQAAYEYANRSKGGFLIGRPGSLTNTAIALKSKPQKDQGYDWWEPKPHAL